MKLITKLSLLVIGGFSIGYLLSVVLGYIK